MTGGGLASDCHLDNCKFSQQHQKCFCALPSWLPWHTKLLRWLCSFLVSRIFVWPFKMVKSVQRRANKPSNGVRDLQPVFMFCFWLSLTSGQWPPGSLVKDERYRFWQKTFCWNIETLLSAVGAVVAIFTAESTQLVKSATRGRKAEAINFYGYCLTNANAIIGFKPPLSSTQYIFSPGSRDRNHKKRWQMTAMRRLRKVETDRWVGWVGGGQVEVFHTFTQSNYHTKVETDGWIGGEWVGVGRRSFFVGFFCISWYFFCISFFIIHDYFWLIGGSVGVGWRSCCLFWLLLRRRKP